MAHFWPGQIMAITGAQGRSKEARRGREGPWRGLPPACLPAWVAGKWKDGATENRGGGAEGRKAECGRRCRCRCRCWWSGMSDARRVGDGESGGTMGEETGRVGWRADWAGPATILGRSLGSIGSRASWSWLDKIPELKS
jgi:hypothetical protein